jgi:hypothetical protein
MRQEIMYLMQENQLLKDKNRIVKFGLEDACVNEFPSHSSSMKMTPIHKVEFNVDDTDRESINEFHETDPDTDLNPV